MYTPDNAWGTDMKQGESLACKVRLARVFKTPGQKMADVMAELKQFTEKDLEACLSG